MSDRVTTHVDNGIAEVCLNRPDRHNALDMDMFEGLLAAGKALVDRRDLRAVILRGDGKSFCSGIDYPSFIAAGIDIQQALFGIEDDGANRAQMAALIWRRIPVPVICAIQGVAFGGGLQIAAGADIRIAAPDAQLSIMEVKWGLVPDMGATLTLANQIGIDRAKELTFTGRIVDGTEAAALGLVTRTDDDPLAATRALAAEIAGKCPDAVRGAKQLFEQAWQIDRERALALEAGLQRTMLASRNQQEAVRAAMEKRTPEFTDPPESSAS